MNTIKLYGALGKEFGRKHSFEIDSVADAIEALRANFPRFFDAIRYGHYRVVVGKTTTKGMELEEAMLPGFKLGKQDLHIVPVTKGSKRGGLGKIIAGIALIGLSMATGGAGFMAASIGTGGMTVGGVVGSVGTSLLLTGVASLLAPEIDAPEDQQSFTMTGPTNTTREGGIIPIVYGEVITGGTMINGSLGISNSDGDTGFYTADPAAS